MRIAVIAGDGIGKDVTAEAVKVLDEAIKLDPANKELTKASDTSKTVAKAEEPKKQK